ncbi:gamma-glutamyltransferase family protein [Pseudonocardia halophobica]|uniref:gamma-glutamyltransferase family protein n=1 Tax=Pseudonocardia halophobica TaxID=29401 RepID=UPI003D907A18
MSASTHWLATGAAQSVLERGGTAVDAATAAAFVLHVVEPHLNGPGGDLVALVAPAGGAPFVLCGQGPAPAGATREHLVAEGLDHVPGAGALAAAVPGAVVAWLRLLAEHGTWELADALEYALDLAEHGYPVVPRLAATIAAVADLFREHWPSSAERWLPGGRVPEAGATLTNPEYAGTLRALLAAGSPGGDRLGRIELARRAWQEGAVAQALEEFAAKPHRHSDGRDHAGVLRAADLAAFRATTEEPVCRDFRGTTVVKAGPWSQGPVLLQALGILDHVGDGRLDPGTAEGAHTIAEALKLALADREAHYGAAAAPGLLDRLLDPDHALARAALIGPGASRELRPSRLDGDPVLPPLRVDGGAAAGTGEPTVARNGETRGDTCHVDVVDRWGTMVSATPSGGWLQSSPTVPGLGFCLGTRLQMSWLDPRSPSRLDPGRRPRTTLSPTLLLRDGAAVAALGTPGGDQQDQWQLLYLLRTLVGGQSPQEAIDSPAFHTTAVPGSFWPRTWTPAGLVVEERLGPEVVAELRGRGHAVTVSGPWTLGRLSVVTRDPATGQLGAAANPRGAQGYAAGR